MHAHLTPLLSAADHCDGEYCALLIAKGADFNFSGTGGLAKDRPKMFVSMLFLSSQERVQGCDHRKNKGNKREEQTIS